MKINTKFSIDDKVWFYIEEDNKYGWGKIIRVEIVILDKEEITYHINNRFYKELDYSSCMLSEQNSDWYRNQYLMFSENEISKNLNGLKRILETSHRDKMNEMKELKMGWWK